MQFNGEDLSADSVGVETQTYRAVLVQSVEKQMQVLRLPLPFAKLRVGVAQNDKSINIPQGLKPQLSYDEVQPQVPFGCAQGRLSTPLLFAQGRSG